MPFITHYFQFHARFPTGQGLRHQIQARFPRTSKLLQQMGNEKVIHSEACPEIKVEFIFLKN